ncbi:MULTISPECIES: hypothetical protein [Actinosynnema]|uniref:hypothetical protein n=1 Tax=Actinosynnema TaxID=40566 RepID=UPI0020A463B1|nr:hypothetical protein [Actinosynnema pretiosum]MCP2098917.1 hypothetical protein [Actinosynnema pretiosum]
MEVAPTSSTERQPPARTGQEGSRFVVRALLAVSALTGSAVAMRLVGVPDPDGEGVAFEDPRRSAKPVIGE